MEALKGPVLVEVDVSKLMGSESFSGGARKLERSSVAIPPSIDRISGSVRRKELALWSKVPQSEFAGHPSRHHVEDASEDHPVGKTNTILPLTLGLEATQSNRNFGKVGRNSTSNSKRSRIMPMDVSINKTGEDGKVISTEISTNPTNCKNGGSRKLRSLRKWYASFSGHRIYSKTLVATDSYMIQRICPSFSLSLKSCMDKVAFEVNTG